ncbi:uncharacterized protein I303_100644 [Kwoniella dejecticola CBS 10117]|uniref:Uncharacterized protein n=1 Tax=Kwoniella dejecticola CBS 10117 TaxID=1296121 RepID=A0A1A6AFI3_9TREE|nr:uncharacterized protein I303_00647 [Kwoniella dejecticola CBS 10117]OBR88830.1 hypothetical protein I303_00647 [Kwoniella dejecticola CBS 10117]
MSSPSIIMRKLWKLVFLLLICLPAISMSQTIPVSSNITVSVTSSAETVSTTIPWTDAPPISTQIAADSAASDRPDLMSTVLTYSTLWVVPSPQSTSTSTVISTTWVDTDPQNSQSSIKTAPSTTSTIPFEAPLSVASSAPTITASEKPSKPASSNAPSSTSETPPKPSTDMQDLINKARDDCTEYFGCFAIVMQSDRIKVKEVGASGSVQSVGPGHWSQQLDNQANEYSQRTFEVTIDTPDAGTKSKKCDYRFLSAAPEDIFISLSVTEEEPYYKLEGYNEQYMELFGQDCGLP